MSAPVQPSQPRSGANRPRRTHYKKTSAIIDDRPDGKPIIFGYGRHFTKRQKEAVQKRIAYASLGFVIALSVVVILVTVIYNSYIYPNQTVASVNGIGISRHDRDTMTSYFTAAQAQATANGQSSQGDPQTLAVSQLQKSLLTKVAAQSKLGVTASMAEAQAQLKTELNGNETSFDSLLNQYHISRDDYLRLVEEPRVLEQKVGSYLVRDNPKTAPMWHYGRISVTTQAKATAILEQLAKGTSFASIYKSVLGAGAQGSSNGGDQGWERTTDGSDPLLTSTFLSYLQAMKKNGTKYQIVKYSSTSWYVLEYLGYDPKHALSSTQSQEDLVLAFNNWISPIQKTAIFDPPLPATDTTTTTQTSNSATGSL